MTKLGDKVTTESRTLGKNLEAANTQLSCLQSQNANTVASIASVAADIAPIKRVVDDTEMAVTRLQTQYATTATNAVEATVQASTTLKLVQLTTYARTISSLVERGLVQPIGGGSGPKTLTGSRYFVYLNPTDGSGLRPFYLETHALSAVLQQPPPTSTEVQLFRVLDAAATGNSYAWTLSDTQRNSLPAPLRDTGEVVTMAVLVEGQDKAVGVLVITRSELDPIFFDSSGSPSDWFSEATDQIANMRDDIAPILADAAQLQRSASEVR
jgi:hypothetical protein